MSTLQAVPRLAKPGRQRWRELDGMRAYAAIAVLLYHTGLQRFQGGFLGVDIFFTLSGFLITSVLLREHQQTGNIHLVKFYFRRGLRLFPAFATLLLACAAFCEFGNPNPGVAPQTLDSLPYAVTYLLNWALIFNWVPAPAGLIGHTWTLAVEEQFYLIWPVVLMLVMRKRRSLALIAWVLAATACAEAVLRAELLTTSLGQHVFLYYAFGAFYSLGGHSDGLILGCALGFAVAAGLTTTRMTSAVVGLVGCLVIVTMVMRVNNQSTLPGDGGFLVVDAATAAIIYSVTRGGSVLTRVLFASHPVRYLGRISYGIYLWHYPTLIVVDANPWVATHFWALWSFRLLLPICFAAISYHVIEQPFLRLKDRSAPRRPRTAHQYRARPVALAEAGRHRP